MQAARHRGHLASAECTGTAAPGAYRTLKCPTRRAPTTLRTAGRLPGHRGNNYSNCEPMLRGAPRQSERRPRRGPEREKEDTGSLTHAWLSRAPPPCQPPLRNPVPPPPAAERMRNDARARGWPGVSTGLKMEDRSKKEEEGEEEDGWRARLDLRQRRSPMRAALIRSASTSVRPPAVGCVCGLFRASLPPSDTTSSQPGAPPHPTRSACAVTRAPADGPAQAPDRHHDKG
ncbi:hypothetical protein EVAR_38473_1 [Eumeta japonica]|uniref:Uncharacterized protein n=1 Tax=Eumeta variegata TaxID=151549 RepID=A0A4C1WQF6_EUMVA|nr:hypothetical protein EVAR_38473_1 [Eumeta japonica]